MENMGMATFSIYSTALATEMGFTPADAEEITLAVLDRYPARKITSRAAAEQAIIETAEDMFIEAWEKAGGYTGDLEADTPWCCPWTYLPWESWKEFLNGSSIEQAAKDNLADCLPAIEKLIYDENIRSCDELCFMADEGAGVYNIGYTDPTGHSNKTQFTLKKGEDHDKLFALFNEFCKSNGWELGKVCTDYVLLAKNQKQKKGDMK